MQLFNKELRSTLPPIRAIENERDPVIHTKIIHTRASWTWYVMAFDGENMLYGIVESSERKWGYFSIWELESCRGRFGGGLERDLNFTPCRVSELPPRAG